MNIKTAISRCVRPLYYGIVGRNKLSNAVNIQRDPLYPMLSSLQEEELNQCIRVTFTGDLILLKDMVENAFDENVDGCQFDSMSRFLIL